LTYRPPGTREFEADYWRTIAALSSGDYVNKYNAACVLDEPTQRALAHPWRDLDGLGEHLLRSYVDLVDSLGMIRKVRIGELPFRWRTQYPFPWMDGWFRNQTGASYERNLLVVIPGKNPHEAV